MPKNDNNSDLHNHLRTRCLWIRAIRTNHKLECMQFFDIADLQNSAFSFCFLRMDFFSSDSRFIFVFLFALCSFLSLCRAKRVVVDICISLQLSVFYIVTLPTAQILFVFIHLCRNCLCPCLVTKVQSVFQRNNWV